MAERKLVEIVRIPGLRIVMRLLPLVAAAGVFVATDSPASAAGPGVIEHIGAGYGEGGVAISADGRFVAFADEGSATVILHDRKLGTSQVVGFTTGFSDIDISADGRYVAFASGQQLVPEDTNAFIDVYIYDREQDSYELVSVAEDGSPGNHHSDGWFDNISLSPDGRFVTFSSLATNLGADGLSLLVRDRELATTAAIAYYAGAADISADGRFVVFDAGGAQVFIHDRDTDEDDVFDEPGDIQTVVLDAAGIWPTISDDGSFVAYFGSDGVTLYNRETGETAVVAPSFGGAAMELSADGRYLAFTTEEALVPEDTNSEGFGTDVYLYDRLEESFQLLSVAKDGSPGNGNSAWGFKGESLAVVALSADGRHAAFHSAATNFVPGEGPGVFVARTSVDSDADTDGDGCLDTRELGDNPTLGGRRSLYNFWDFFDVPTGMAPERDKMVTVGDLSGIVARFGAFRKPPPTEEKALAEALMPPPPPPAYHAAFDRGGPIPGQHAWNLLPPDGAITIMDIAGAIAQFGHTCA